VLFTGLTSQSSRAGTKEEQCPFLSILGAIEWGADEGTQVTFIKYIHLKKEQWQYVMRVVK
jgi:hypothetical protein